MVTADIVEEIIKVVDENPVALEALRARLLTRELLETPARLARLSESHERLTESHERFAESTNERLDSLESTLRQFIATTNEFIATTNEFIATTNKFIESANKRFDSLDTTTKALRHDVGVFKGHYARDLAEKMAFSIAHEHGFAFKRVVPKEAVWEMINASDTSGISGDDLRSFSVADLIIQAADAGGADCYIAAEVSYTAHWDDAERAIRNAEFIARFTRRDAHPLVAGVDVNARVREFVIETGKALWVQLPDRIVQAD